jgi:hypothetical protein
MRSFGRVLAAAMEAATGSGPANGGFGIDFAAGFAFFGLAGLSEKRGWLTDGAPAAASSSGCVTVAAKARLRAAAQSLQSFAPAGASQPQMRHFIRLLP